MTFMTGEQGNWPCGQTELATMIRNYDWSQTSLGPISSWPQSIRTAVDICLDYPLPSALVCGPDSLLLYNDACASLQGDAHPQSLGLAAEGFPEALSNEGPIHHRLMSGEAMVFRKRPWVFQRLGVLTTGHYDVIFTPVRDEAGEVAHVFATVLDAQADSVALPTETASARMAGPDVLWVLDPERMRLTYASPALDTLLGQDRSKVQADFNVWLGMVHPDDRERAHVYLICTPTPDAAVEQYRIVRPSDGGVVLVRHTSFSMTGEFGTPGQIIGLVQDITAIELGNAALLQEKERYRVLAEGIPPLVWRSSDDGLWTWAGQRWLDYTGQTQEQSHGWGWLDAVHPQDRQPTMAAWHQARPHGMLDARFRLRRASDQSWRWFQTRSLLRRVEPAPGEPEGKIVEWLGSSNGNHDLMLLQAEQDRMIADLRRRTERLKGVVSSLGGSLPSDTGNDAAQSEVVDQP